MKVTFYSNFFNHHQEPMALEFINQGCDYTFVATEEIPEERIKLGYEDMNKKYDFILRTYESEENRKKAMDLAKESDIVIIGSAPEYFIEERIKLNKITFRYSERIFKKGRWMPNNIKAIIYGLKKYKSIKNKKCYLLCASAYAAKDYLMLGAYKNKAYKWGYFPQFKEQNINELLKKKENTKLKILWAGRFLDWKHPEYVIYLAKELLKNNYKDFEVTMLGNGNLYDEIEKQINKNNLQEYIKLIGAVPSSEVRKYMEEANIYIFTSDKGEGWGAVLNEAMNSACAVVANSSIGAVPYLIQNNVNGLCYKNKKEFLKGVLKLVKSDELRKDISIKAYNQVADVWNYESAVKNLLELYNNIENNKEIIESGPCSRDKDYL